MKRKRNSPRAGISRWAFTLAVLIMALPFLITSPAPIDYAVEEDIVEITPAPATPAPVATPWRTPRPAKTAAPSATGSPTPGPVSLPMNDFSTGSKPLSQGFSAGAYDDGTITVTITREKVGRGIYTSADVVISDPSQLRTALGGTARRSATARISKIAKRNNAVIAINGDFYTFHGNYTVKQSTRLRKFSGGSFDLLIIDNAGDLHIFRAKDAKRGIGEFEGNIYQAFSFGPALIIDGEKQPMQRSYEFGPGYKNPRTAIGQLGPLHYLLLVVDGRTDFSAGATTDELTDFLFDKGCSQAYNLDGGGSSAMYFNGKVINKMTYSGERSIPDIIYFASTAQIKGGEGA